LCCTGIDKLNDVAFAEINLHRVVSGNSDVGRTVFCLLDASPAVIYSFEAKGDFAPTFVSENIARLFGYAAPEYLEKNGVPQSHVDLPRFDLLAWGSVDMKAQWHLSHGEMQVMVEFRPRLICNDLMLLRQSVLSGLGIAALPAFICKRDLAEGRIVEVLPGWRPPGRSFFAVFPHHQVMPTRVRSFIDFLVERLRPALSWEMG